MVWTFSKSWLVWRSKGVNNFVCDMWGFRSQCPAFPGIRALYFNIIQVACVSLFDHKV